MLGRMLCGYRINGVTGGPNLNSAKDVTGIQQGDGINGARDPCYGGSPSVRGGRNCSPGRAAGLPFDAFQLLAFFCRYDDSGLRQTLIFDI